MNKVYNRGIFAFDNTSIKINGLLFLHRSRVSKKIWIVVEGVDDKRLFDRLIPSKDIYISDSAVKPNGTGNCDNVVLIVTQMRLRVNEMPVVGIRDRDHLTFVRQINQPIWKNVFFTDKRDMENMVLSSENSVKMMENDHPGFTSKLNKVMQMTRPMGVLRVYNSLHHTGVDMKSILSPDNTMQPNSLIWKQANWEKMLITLFNDALPPKRRNKRKNLSLKQFDKFNHLLSRYNDDMVCQGHDIVKYLYHSKPFTGNVSKERLYPMLYKYYADSGDFKNTQLYSDLCSWIKDNANIVI